MENPLQPPVKVNNPAPTVEQINADIITQVNRQNNNLTILIRFFVVILTESSKYFDFSINILKNVSHNYYIAFFT